VILLLAFPALAKDIAIGFTVSETGALNVDSTPQLQGFQLWRDAVNARGGIKVGGADLKVRFVHYDDQSKSDRVQQLYSRLVVQDKADFLFSPYSSGLTATAAVITEQYGRIMITTGAAEPKTYQLGNQYLFQMYSPAQVYLTGVVDAVKSVDPAAKFAVAYKDDSFAKAVAGAAKAYVQSQGLALAFDEGYAPSTTDFGPIIKKVMSSGANVLIGGGHYADGATLARQFHDQQANMKLIALLVAPDSPKFATLGEAATNIIAPSQWAAEVAYKVDFGPEPAAFVRAFREKFGAEPGYHAAGGYAAGLILERAIGTAGSLDTDKVAAALNAVDASTFFGRIRFAREAERHGLQVGHEMVLVQWQKGGDGLTKQVVWPIAAQTAQLVYPMR
jgi:branched-chain amino acid transport system substrate-binding protein